MIDAQTEIFNVISRCCKNCNKPDLHSFTAKIRNGTVFVDCRKQEVYIKEFHCDKTTEFVGLPVAAANRLEMLGIDYETIEI